MKHILIVDDNPHKLDDLAKSAQQLFPQARIEKYECQNDFLRAVCYEYLQEALKEPEELVFIVDMQMPRLVGEQIDIEGGLDALAWLDQVGVRCPAIIASSEQIDEARAQDAYATYKGFVYYSAWSSPKSAMRELLVEYLVT